MEQKQLKQFTFYDLYTELMDVLNDEERGKLLRRMCEYMFVSGEQNELTDKKLIYLWGNIVDYLDADKKAQINGKSVRVSRQMKHFTFYRNFYEAVELMEDKQVGQYIKAIYNYDPPSRGVRRKRNSTTGGTKYRDTTGNIRYCLYTVSVKEKCNRKGNSRP